MKGQQPDLTVPTPLKKGTFNYMSTKAEIYPQDLPRRRENESSVKRAFLLSVVDR